VLGTIFFATTSTAAWMTELNTADLADVNLHFEGRFQEGQTAV
jgi:hypothetical protein